MKQIKIKIFSLSEDIKSNSNNPKGLFESESRYSSTLSSPVDETKTERWFLQSQEKRN